MKMTNFSTKPQTVSEDLSQRYNYKIIKLKTKAANLFKIGQKMNILNSEFVKQITNLQKVYNRIKDLIYDVEG